MAKLLWHKIQNTMDCNNVPQCFLSCFFIFISCFFYLILQGCDYLGLDLVVCFRYLGYEISGCRGKTLSLD